MPEAYTRLTLDHIFKPFDCGDSDLNDFLLSDSKDNLRELLAVTYLYENEDKTVAFFSLGNDKITVHDAANKSQFKKVAKLIPFLKRGTNKGYPAMKLGRLGIHTDHQSQRIGTQILNYLKYWFIDNNKTGCRFITVDAYNKSIPFYEKNGFQFLDDEKPNAATRLMYFDLIKISGQ